MLLFGKYTQRWFPAMTAKCICFVGNNLGGTQFRDKVNDANIEGNLLHQFETIMDFFTRNLRHIQVGDEFNSQGVLEIPYISLVEFTVNALVHRSLNATAPIRIFIFDDRVEMHSPGTLPNGLSVDDIVVGTSMPRNMFLFTNAIHLLPYTGAGSGMLRALSENMNVSFINNDRTNEFVITINRPVGNQVNEKSNQASNESNQVMTANECKSNQADKESNQPRVNLVTRKLTKKEEDIRNFCSVPRTAQDIMDRLNISNQSKNRQKYITSLIELGVLERSIPEKPNDPNQKYRRKK